jgi:hypothetical protein
MVFLRVETADALDILPATSRTTGRFPFGFGQGMCRNRRDHKAPSKTRQCFGVGVTQSAKSPLWNGSPITRPAAIGLRTLESNSDNSPESNLHLAMSFGQLHHGRRAGAGHVPGL